MSTKIHPRRLWSGTYADAAVVGLVLGPVQASNVLDLAPEHDGVPGGALLPHLS